MWVALGENVRAHCTKLSSMTCRIRIEGTGDMFDSAEQFYVYAGNPDSLTFYNWQQAVDTFAVGVTSDGTFVHNVLYIPDGITSIADNFFNPFDFMQSLRGVWIGQDVKRIGNSAFENLFSELIQVYISEDANIESLGNRCFYGNQDLKYIDFRGKTKIIGQECFDGCKSITTLNLSTDLEYIPQQAFNDCHSLVWFNRGNIVRGVEEGSGLHGALKNCHSLEYLTIREDVYIEEGDTCWLDLNTGSNCNDAGLQITTINTNNPQALALDWVKQFNRYPVFVKNYPFIELNHLGKWCSINGYGKDYGDLPISHKGVFLRLKTVEEGSPLASPLVFKHKGKWYWIAN